MASAVAVACFFRTSGIAPCLPRPVLAVGSLFCFATATLGRLGWGGQTIKGDTSVELLDQRLFHVLYWIGMCWGGPRNPLKALPPNQRLKVSARG